MKRPKLRKASKRMSCSKRFKIQKKVREHNRKVAKEAKKTGRRKPKRDISIPNDAPFKEDILREAEQRKQRREELKAQQKRERQNEVAKKRQLDKKTDKPDKKTDKPDKKTDKLDKKKKEVKEKKELQKPKKPDAKKSTSSICSDVNKLIETSDVVLEVLDARDPLGTRCLQAEQAVLQSPNKRLLLVLNKIDLVPKDNIEKWLHFLNHEIPTVAFKCSTQVQDKNMAERSRKDRNGCVDLSKGTVCLGRDSLLRILHGLCPSPNEGIKVGLIGFSNVGKSSLINSLKQFRVCNVGALKGTTRCLQDVKVDQQIKMIDSPSLIVSPDNPPVTILMRSVFPRDDDLLNGIKMILKQCNHQQIILHYNIPNFRNSLEFLDLLAHKRGLLKKGGVADIQGAAKVFMNDWMGARLSYHTPPPTHFKSHISNLQTGAMQKGINRKLLEEDNKKIVKATRTPSPSGTIAFQFSHLTNGIIDETEIKQDPEPKEEESDEELVEEGEDESDEELVEDEEEESKSLVLPETSPELTDSSKTATKSVRFDKLGVEADDAYDFNTDFN